jgi:hypothetical protein
MKSNQDVPSGSGSATRRDEETKTAPAGTGKSRIETLHVPGKRAPRRVKVRDDVDPDYAEEAEDFFYGEGR